MRDHPDPLQNRKGRGNGQRPGTWGRVVLSSGYLSLFLVKMSDYEPEESYNRCVPIGFTSTWFWYRSSISAVLSDETPDETTRVPGPIVSIWGVRFPQVLSSLGTRVQGRNEWWEFLHEETSKFKFHPQRTDCHAQCRIVGPSMGIKPCFRLDESN